MRGLNKVELMGNLGNDVELKYTQDGTAVGTFSLATTEKFKGRDGNMQERTQWHRCKVFGKRAEALAEYVKKGSPLLVSDASIRYGKYTGSDGVEKYTTDIIVNDFRFIGGNDRGGDQSRKPAQRQDVPKSPQYDDVPFDDDIPF